MTEAMTGFTCPRNPKGCSVADSERYGCVGMFCGRPDYVNTEIIYPSSIKLELIHMHNKIQLFNVVSNGSSIWLEDDDGNEVFMDYSNRIPLAELVNEAEAAFDDQDYEEEE